MKKGKKKKYSYYACYKNSKGGGATIGPKDNAADLKNALVHLMEHYMNNEAVFVGIIKCSDGNPLSKIYDLN